ncbi:MAG: hypothetical protein EOP83_17705 [Verrucomicrobiaceae bacterium]|nr:MAG: hypothetical protein EOP83_17705 [Verrucomicrobiaceae bacterium]
MDKRAYLITLEYLDHASTHERRIIDHEAWTFIQEGGDPPQKVFNDAKPFFDSETDAYNALTLNDDESDDEEVQFRKRCFVVQNSSFGGEALSHESDINALIAFVTKHGLQIEDEGYADNNF